MQGLRIIRLLTMAERQHLERLSKKTCEAPGCPSSPECTITLDRKGEPPLLVYACIRHAAVWTTEGEAAVPDETDAEKA